MAPGWEQRAAVVLRRPGRSPTRSRTCCRRSGSTSGSSCLRCRASSCSALAIALARSVRTPVLFPLRLFAAALRRHRSAACRHPVALPDRVRRRRLLGTRPRRGTRSARCCPGLGGAGHHLLGLRRRGVQGRHRERPREPARRPPARSGCRPGRPTAHVVLPQAVRRVVPPLMNDFISLQKDVALVSLIGPVEACGGPTSEERSSFNFTPFVVAAVLFLPSRSRSPGSTDYLLAKERRRMSGTGRRWRTPRSRPRRRRS